VKSCLPGVGVRGGDEPGRERQEASKRKRAIERRRVPSLNEIMSGRIWCCKVCVEEMR